MARKTAVVLSRRERNKAERASRRNEIARRWAERVQRRENVATFLAEAGKRDLSLAEFVDWIIVANDWFLEDPVGIRDDMIDRRGDGDRVLIHYLVRIIQLKEMEYDSYLKTAEWRVKADAAKLKYRGRCALDAKHAAEHAHHRTYERRGRELPDDLIPLCADCHRRFHGK